MSDLYMGRFGNFAAVTKSDSTLVTCKAIFVGGAGNVALSIDGSTAAVTLTGVIAGQILPIALNGGRIMSTNTTATNMAILF
jgi:hypothetical protein